MQPNTIAFVVAYLLLMVPTYVLPYFGSNSSIVNAVSAVAGLGMTPQWWAHAWSLVMLCLLNWARGGVIGRAWLPILPILASFFDLTPGLSAIPLVPTLLHVGGMLAGVIGASAGQDEIAANHQSALNRKAIKGVIVATLCAIGGSAIFLIAAQTTTKRLSSPKPNAAPATVPTAATPSLPKPPLSGATESQYSPTYSVPATVEQSNKNDPRPPAKRTTKPSDEAKVKPAATGTTTRYINLND